MDDRALLNLLQEIREGTVSVEEGLRLIRSPGYENLGFARVDHQRALRRGFPEVIYCPGKTISQIVRIAKSIGEQGQDILATRAEEEVFEALQASFPNCRYYPRARLVSLQKRKRETLPGKVLVVTAGTADIPVAEEAAETARIMGCQVDKLYDVGVAGLHRLLDNQERLYEATLLIVVAGMEGALASVVGGLVDTPVIAVPTSVGYGANFEGLSSLLAMLNSCASGVTVVNIDNGFGAGFAAALIKRTFYHFYQEKSQEGSRENDEK
ncbi:MAG: nickel pincer cofactor biosynthesis protein LarB [Candidatus Syntrophonatronum acetioxidans]|uniref:Nickel pincer cofactor biosynthesis protein LarB n=1 Tax=Candidatus Syntrophonatronum acetioxidans TaxID=1795816 RepID=A0A424YFX4_9FIRM|nr:MAG: nickel pincer cofactor biosynthesis protein LarB [Candidatus Syntrophonatronum acetioxidans]